MSVEARFLRAFGRSLSALALYRHGHPARERAVDEAYGALLDLQDDVSRPLFTFLEDEVLLGGRPLPELRGWDWSERLGRAGIQRLEFEGGVTREDFEGFLDEVAARLTAEAADTAAVRQMRETKIRFGEVGVKGEDEVPEEGEPLASEGIAWSLADEAEAVRWMHGEVGAARELPLAEAEAVVRSLSVAMHGDREVILPLLRLRSFDEYTTTHSLNVSVLAMALAEFLGLGSRDVRSFGIAGLLHDIGKVKIPREVLTKPGRLTDEEFALIRSHTVEGARILVDEEGALDLAAVVAYEHHVMLDGGGYPEFRFPRACHHGSRIVHVCDVYDALRTKRPYRDAWSSERVLGYIEERAGEEFDPTVARSFVRMMRLWEPRVAELTREDEELRVDPGGPGATGGEGGDDWARPTGDVASDGVSGGGKDATSGSEGGREAGPDGDGG